MRPFSIENLKGAGPGKWFPIGNNYCNSKNIRLDLLLRSFHHLHVVPSNMNNANSLTVRLVLKAYPNVCYFTCEKN